MPVVLHLQISQNTFFLYELTETTAVYFCGNGSFLVVSEALLH